LIPGWKKAMTKIRRDDPGGSIDSVTEARSVLGVKRGADFQAIKKAWQNKLRETHPDRSGRNDTVNEFYRVQIAYDFLKCNKSTKLKRPVTSRAKNKDKRRADNFKGEKNVQTSGEKVPDTRGRGGGVSPTLSSECTQSAAFERSQKEATVNEGTEAHWSPPQGFKSCGDLQKNALHFDRMEQLAQQQAAIELQKVDFRRSTEIGSRLIIKMIEDRMAPKGRGRCFVKKCP